MTLAVTGICGSLLRGVTWFEAAGATTTGAAAEMIVCTGVSCTGDTGVTGAGVIGDQAGD